MTHQRWSGRATLAAFSLYCRLPFGKLHARNPDIIELARALGRTPASLAMKCCNLASLDETHKQRGVRGLQKAAQLDRQVWNEFLADPETISFEAEQAVDHFTGQARLAIEDDAVMPFVEGQEREALVRVRVNQRFFREMILASYSEGCAVCRLPFVELLVASHIVPWSLDGTLRMNPCNGICLCGTHDLAFERGLLLIHSDYTLHIPDRVSQANTLEPVHTWLCRYAGQNLSLPDRWTPDPSLLTRRLAILGALPLPGTRW
jgi:putative restriction endonuclease